MEWPIFAVVQMALVTIGVAVAFWLRIREIAKQNALLRVAVAESSGSDPEEAARTWLQDRINALDESEFSPAIKRILENQLNPSETFLDELRPLLPTDGAAADPDQAAEIERLNAELEAALQKVSGDEESGAPPVDVADVEGSDSPSDGEVAEVESEELKALLQQFTRDSREMMACIQTLETENASLLAENAKLKEALGITDDAPASDDAATEAESDAA